jgi:hypothetical protein
MAITSRWIRQPPLQGLGCLAHRHSEFAELVVAALPGLFLSLLSLPQEVARAAQ